jgi:hypothetical protein
MCALLCDFQPQQVLTCLLHLKILSGISVFILGTMKGTGATKDDEEEQRQEKSVILEGVVQSLAHRLLYECMCPVAQERFAKYGSAGGEINRGLFYRGCNPDIKEKGARESRLARALQSRQGSVGAQPELPPDK